MRSAGILMPITSLPSPYGIGTLGAEARAFADFLKKGGQTYWQILPICPTGYGDSPYQSFSTYAGNPYMIDFEDLTQMGLLEKSDYAQMDWGADPCSVDYGLQYQQRFVVLRKACKKVIEKLGSEYTAFEEEQKNWLSDYALYMSIKNSFGGASWRNWPEALRRRETSALKEIKEKLVEEIDFWKKVQFLFFYQWKQLKTYANAQGIRIIGDLPIYVSEDSSDVWAHPEQFQLDKNLIPIEVSGCPADGFSLDGQVWGNPLFDWEYMEKTSFSWWVERVAYQKKIYDVIRIDHFRGFDEYFTIPAGDLTARNGRWRPGPGMRLFRELEKQLGKLDIIVEDLGFLTPSVKQLLKDTGFPGMKVLEFAFDSRDSSCDYMPHSYPRNCVVYAGTHDNDPVLGWMENALPEDVQKAIHYFRLSEAEGYEWGMMRSVWASVGDTAIVQMQDLLGLGAESRMNTPATTGKNWCWRCKPGDYNDELAMRLAEEMRIYER